MRRGFTLLELMIVVIIIGTLATLGVMQFAGALEKSRGAEAKQILGQLRSQCAAIYIGSEDGTDCDATSLMIGTATNQTPSTCRASNYFTYSVVGAADGIASTATRCTASGKTPNASTAGTAILTTDFALGTDVWSGTGGY